MCLSLPRLYGGICAKRIKCSPAESVERDIIGRLYKNSFEDQSNYVKLLKISNKMTKLYKIRDKNNTLQTKGMMYNLLK